MSHKNKSLTWYQLYLRIAKMQLADAQSKRVSVRVNGTEFPALLGYDDSGRVAYIEVNTNSTEQEKS